jgi:hypothetical protein
MDMMGVWDVVSEKTPKPAADGGDGAVSAKDWTRLSRRAKGFLLLNIEPGLMPLISSAEHAPSAWKMLEEKFHCKKATSLHSLLKMIMTLHRGNKMEVATHLERYHELWQRLLD